MVIVLPNSGTLIFLRLDNEPPLCQNGMFSGLTAVSLKDVGERPMDSAIDLSDNINGLARPTGLLEADGQS